MAIRCGLVLVSLALTATLDNADGSRQDIPGFAEARGRPPLDDETHAHHAHPH